MAVRAPSIHQHPLGERPWEPVPGDAKRKTAKAHGAARFWEAARIVRGWQPATAGPRYAQSRPWCSQPDALHYVRALSLVGARAPVSTFSGQRVPVQRKSCLQAVILFHNAQSDGGGRGEGTGRACLGRGSGAVCVGVLNVTGANQQSASGPIVSTRELTVLRWRLHCRSFATPVREPAGCEVPSEISTLSTTLDNRTYTLLCMYGGVWSFSGPRTGVRCQSASCRKRWSRHQLPSSYRK